MDDHLGFLHELDKAFAILNEKLFDKRLTQVSFVLQPRKKISIRYLPDSAIFAVGSDFLTLELSDVLPTLLHEMIHVSNAQQGIVDCTTNQYHNKQFLNCALALGLVVIKHKTQGWSITTTLYPRNVVEREFIRRPIKEAERRRGEAFAAVKFDRLEYKKFRSELRSRIKSERPVKTFFLKYTCNCPPPHNSIRSGRRPDGPNALKIQCQNCRRLFVCVSDG